MITLLIVLVATLGMLAGWRACDGEAPVVAVVSRTIEDVSLTWRCDNGHTFVDAGQYTPRNCIRCSLAAYPVDTYDCPLHGSVQVMARFGEGPDGPAVVELRVVGQSNWQPASDPVLCPVCGNPIPRKVIDPLEHMRKRPSRRP